MLANSPLFCNFFLFLKKTKELILLDERKKKAIKRSNPNLMKKYSEVEKLIDQNGLFIFQEWKCPRSNHHNLSNNTVNKINKINKINLLPYFNKCENCEYECKFAQLNSHLIFAIKEYNELFEKYFNLQTMSLLPGLSKSIKLNKIWHCTSCEKTNFNFFLFNSFDLRCIQCNNQDEWVQSNPHLFILLQEFTNDIYDLYSYSYLLNIDLSLLFQNIPTTKNHLNKETKEEPGNKKVSEKNYDIQIKVANSILKSNENETEIEHDENEIKQKEKVKAIEKKEEFITKKKQKTKKKVQKQKNKVSSSTVDLNWTCVFCTYKNNFQSNICLNCQKDFSNFNVKEKKNFFIKKEETPSQNAIIEINHKQEIGGKKNKNEEKKMRGIIININHLTKNNRDERRNIQKQTENLYQWKCPFCGISNITFSLNKIGKEELCKKCKEVPRNGQNLELRTLHRKNYKVNKVNKTKKKKKGTLNSNLNPKGKQVLLFYFYYLISCDSSRKQFLGPPFRVPNIGKKLSRDLPQT